MSQSPVCPACSSSETRAFFALRNAPVLCNRLHETAESAKSAPCASIELGFCTVCGLVYNTVFDESLLDYDAAYETSLHFSNRFQSFAEQLARDLLDRYGDSGKTIVEIGSGEGEFLQLLTAGGNNECIGFDKSTSRASETGVPGMRLVNDYYSPASHDLRADLVCCRHVLEHIAEPEPFLANVSGLLGRESAVYFEVPDGRHTLTGAGIWDVIYEHPIYFTAPALLRLFRKCGFHVTRLESVFGGQFLALEARTEAALGEVTEAKPGLDELSEMTYRFQEHFSTVLGEWGQRISDATARGQRIAIWGAGSKGVTFVNCVETGHEISSAIDINPRKQGRFIPGAGQQIKPPESIVSDEVGLVLVMNPIYTDEIRETVRGLGSRAEVTAV